MTVFHPLVPHDGGIHELRTWEAGELISERRWRRPSWPPLTYPIDLVTPLRTPAVDCWFGFNPLACWQGVRARDADRTQKAIYWCVDYTPERFGRNPLTRLYERLEGFCCEHADYRFDISAPAAEARSTRHRGRPLAPVRIVPIGAWIERVPTTSAGSWTARRVVYLGNLIESQGGPLLIDALARLARDGVDFTAEVIGRGPLEAVLRGRATELGIADRVLFSGYIEDDREVEHRLARSTVGVAVYDPETATFTRWADPAKLKAYLAAGLPSVLTDVPPNARQVEAAGAAEVVPFEATSVAEALRTLLDDREAWERTREAALRTAAQYDWAEILGGALDVLGYRA